MFPLHIRLKKRADGSSAQSCTRVDGSVTWQNQRQGLAAFFTRHDLTHVAVETVLRHRLGFYGLLASGWDFTDFGSPWPRGPIPASADPSELIVGMLDAERASGTRWSAAQLNEHIGQFYAAHGIVMKTSVTDRQLGEVRAMLADLLARWAAVAPGDAMELDFDPRG